MAKHERKEWNEWKLGIWRDMRTATLNDVCVHRRCEWCDAMRCTHSPIHISKRPKSIKKKMKRGRTKNFEFCRNLSSVLLSQRPHLEWDAIFVVALPPMMWLGYWTVNVLSLVFVFFFFGSSTRNVLDIVVNIRTKCVRQGFEWMNNSIIFLLRGRRSISPMPHRRYAKEEHIHTKFELCRVADDVPRTLESGKFRFESKCRENRNEFVTFLVLCFDADEEIIRTQSMVGWLISVLTTATSTLNNRIESTTTLFYDDGDSIQLDVMKNGRYFRGPFFLVRYLSFQSISAWNFYSMRPQPSQMYFDIDHGRALALSNSDENIPNIPTVSNEHEHDSILMRHNIILYAETIR